MLKIALLGFSLFIIKNLYFVKKKRKMTTNNQNREYTEITVALLDISPSIQW